MAELDEHIVPGLDGVINLPPETQVDETLGAAPVLSVVDHLHATVQKVLEHHSPSALRIGSSLEVLLRHRTVPHQVNSETAANKPHGCYDGEMLHNAAPLTVTFWKVMSLV